MDVMILEVFSNINDSVKVLVNTKECLRRWVFMTQCHRSQIVMFQTSAQTNALQSLINISLICCFFRKVPLICRFQPGLMMMYKVLLGNEVTPLSWMRAEVSVREMVCDDNLISLYTLLHVTEYMQISPLHYTQ